MKSYRIDYPASIMFDIDAESRNEAIEKAKAKLEDAVEGFDLEIFGADGRGYPVVDTDGEIDRRMVSIADVMEARAK